MNLQRSQWGPQYYLNLGLWLLHLGETSNPREDECHIRIRAGELLSLQEAGWDDALLDLETPWDDEKRAMKIKATAEAFRALLETMSSLHGIKELYRAGLLDDAAIVKEARALLEQEEGR